MMGALWSSLVDIFSEAQTVYVVEGNVSTQEVSQWDAYALSEECHALCLKNTSAIDGDDDTLKFCLMFTTHARAVNFHIKLNTVSQLSIASKTCTPSDMAYIERVVDADSQLTHTNIEEVKPTTTIPITSGLKLRLIDADGSIFIADAGGAEKVYLNYSEEYIIETDNGTIYMSHYLRDYFTGKGVRGDVPLFLLDFVEEEEEHWLPLPVAEEAGTYKLHRVRLHAEFSSTHIARLLSPYFKSHAVVDDRTIAFTLDVQDPEVFAGILATKAAETRQRWQGAQNGEAVPSSSPCRPGQDSRREGGPGRMQIEPALDDADAATAAAGGGGGADEV